MSALYDKYRPTDIAEVVGQDGIVESIQFFLQQPDRPHAYMFVGPSGTGKTTMARILATGLNCTANGLREIDAAKNSGIDNFRALSDSMYQGVLDSKVVVAIVDEAHLLRPDTWDSLLKSIEEPPDHFYWVFCTTDADRVPKRVQNRCKRYDFGLVDPDVLRLRVYFVALSEYALEEDDVRIDLAVAYAGGCPRQALNNLETVMSVSDVEQAEKLLINEAEINEEGVIGQIAQAMVHGDKMWSSYYTLLQSIPDKELARAKPVLSMYISKCLWGCKNGDRAKGLAMILDSIDQMPAYPEPWNQRTSLLMAIWRVLLM